MKVIFLDFDGVIVVNWKSINLASIPHLAHIIDQTGAKIVISSSWKNHYTLDELAEMLWIAGINKSDVIDKTPYVDYERGKEISKWLYGHPEVKSFVILDDSVFDMMEYVNDGKVVETNQSKGITREDAEKAISILESEDNELDISIPQE